LLSANISNCNGMFGTHTLELSPMLGTQNGENAYAFSPFFAY